MADRVDSSLSLDSHHDDVVDSHHDDVVVGQCPLGDLALLAQDGVPGFGEHYPP